jgi:hypothetical protein
MRHILHHRLTISLYQSNKRGEVSGRPLENDSVVLRRTLLMHNLAAEDANLQLTKLVFVK